MNLEQIFFDEDADILDELQELMDKLPKESSKYKALCNLKTYLGYVADNGIDLEEDTPASMAARSLRVMGYLKDRPEDEIMATLIIQSALEAWRLINASRGGMN